MVVEIKSIESIKPINEAELFPYLRLGGWKVGLFINVNVAMLENGICRRIL